MHPPASVEEHVASMLGARSARIVERIQTLWSGYGDLLRMELDGSIHNAVVVKVVRPPSQRDHPRGWSNDRSHQRKLRSYEVERHFYANYAEACPSSCRVAKMLASTKTKSGWVLILEDLNAAGFSGRGTQANMRHAQAGLRWLARFHGHHLSVRPDGLWKQGTYWHLKTRPDELRAIKDPRLRAAASKIDEVLRKARFKTLVHGDAKLAKLCFSQGGAEVAAVDFQYVGGGVGVQDVAYLISSCFEPEQCQAAERDCLAIYFDTLRASIADASLAEEIEQEWRELYPYAWADFVRFLAGWAPDHWKLHRYSRALTEQVLEDLG